MTDLHHSKFPLWLEQGLGAKAPSVYLLHGESVLVDQCASPLIDRLLDGAPKDLHCEVLDGIVDNIPDLLEHLNTYDLMGGTKVVWFKDAKLYDSGSGHQKAIEQISQHYEGEDLTKAARGFVNLCGRLGADAATIADTGRVPTELADLVGAIGDDAVERLAQLCVQKGWAAASSIDNIDSLEQSIAKGFPNGHFLVVTSTAKVPKNRKLYKIILERGVIVDCHVPLGERRADKQAQEGVLRQIMDDRLKKSGKRIPPGLFNKIVQLTGFDPTTFRSNIDKLVDYVGERSEITDADVHALLRRTKTDPIYALTNAVADRDAVSALFYLKTLLDDAFHPLQILSALSNQVRKLLVAKDFTTSDYGRVWQRGMAYSQFQNSVMPAVQAYDTHMANQAAQWDSILQPSSPKQKKGAKGGGLDLALASNAGSAYPVYQTLLKSDNFTRGELPTIMVRLSETDLKLKRSGQDPVLLIKQLILSLCTPVQ